MEQDDVCFDAKLLQIANSLLQVLEEGRLEAAPIERPAAGRFFPESNRLARTATQQRKRVKLRLIAIEVVTLREDAHAHFVERSSPQRLECLLLQLLPLMCPRVARRADLLVRCPIFIREMVGVSNANRTVIVFRRGRSAGEHALLLA